MKLAAATGAPAAAPAHFIKEHHERREAAPVKTGLVLRVWLAATLAAAALAVPARAAYDDLGNSARVSGMSNAFTAVADDAYAIYYNPAGLALLDRPEIATTYSLIVTGLSDNSNVQNSFLAYAQPIKDGQYGTAGIGWNYFSLDNIYRESSLFLSYGNRLTPKESDYPIYGGISTKYLYRSINPGAIAGNSISNTGVVQTGVADPLLQNGAKSNLDVDLGLLWQVMPRWDVGWQVQHLFTPNIAFTPGQTDTLQRNMKFGGAYRTPYSTLAADFDIVTAPDGTLERDINLGAEKWLPTLLYGSFGVRGGVGYGTDDYRQVTVGLSYKVHRLQVDYGFVMPVGSFASTNGTHRIGLTWRFGNPAQAEKLIGEMMLDDLTQVAPAGTPEFNRQAEALVAYKTRAVEALMREADAEAAAGRFASAYGRAQEAGSLAPQDAVLAEVVGRYRTAALYFPDISAGLADRSSSASAVSAGATRDGLMKFIAGKDREALANLVNARALTPTQAHDAMIRILQARLGETMLGISTGTAVAVSSGAVPAMTVSTDVAQIPPVYIPPISAPHVEASTEAPHETASSTIRHLLDSATALMELAFFQQDWDKVVEYARQVISLDAKNILAYKRIAAAMHVQKRYAEALKALTTAYALDTDPIDKQRLKSYIDALKAQIARGSKKKAPETKPTPAKGSPEDVERFYDAGVELYAQGKLSEALEAFHRCLQVDPDYVPAQRAYDRIQSELKQSGSGR
jgi:tetratricopeptide (TPR) repeat protein